MDVGQGTNTKEELMALWGLLYFARSRQITKLFFLGDSKVIVDLALEIHNIHYVYLFHWLGKV